MSPSPSAAKTPSALLPSISPAWVVGFIGHRMGIDEAALAPVVQTQLERLSKEVGATGGTLHFYSSVADGADLMALDAADRLSLPLHVVLPLPEEDFLRPFPSDADRLRAQDRLTAIRARPGRHTWRIAPTSMQLPDAYFEADTCIVDACDVLMVVWDGKPEVGLGGTAQLVALAKAKGRPLVWIHRDRHTVEREGFDEAWSKQDEKLHLLEERGVARLDWIAPGTDTTADTARLKTNLSALADKDARWFRGAVALVGGVSAAAALCGAFLGLLPHDTAAQKIAAAGLGVAEFFLLIWVLRFKSNDHRKKIRDEWIDARFGAEIYRGLKSSQPLLDPLHPPVMFLRPEWRRFALTLGLRLHAEKAADFDFAAFRQGYLKDRIENQQITFFRKQGRRAVRWAAAWTRLGDMSIVATAVIVSLVCLNRVWEGTWHDGAWGMLVLGVFPVLFPLIAGLASSLALLLDDDRRAARYPELEQRLAALALELPHRHTLGSLRQIVATTEAILLDELLEWYSVTSQADPS